MTPSANRVCVCVCDVSALCASLGFVFRLIFTCMLCIGTCSIIETQNRNTELQFSHKTLNRCFFHFILCCASSISNTALWHWLSQSFQNQLPFVSPPLLIPANTNTTTNIPSPLPLRLSFLPPRRVSLRHNGIEVVSAYGDASGYQMGSQSAVLNLRSGDRVYLQLDEGRLYDSSSSSRGYTTFSGFRIR